MFGVARHHSHVTSPARKLWLLVPGFMAAFAALNRAAWLLWTGPNIEGLHSQEFWGWTFLGAGAFIGTASVAALWRVTRTPWAAIVGLTVWGSYATTIMVELGWRRVQGTSVDLLLLAVLIAWNSTDLRREFYA